MNIPSNAKTIWDYLKAHTDYNETGIAAIMGNLYAESGLEPNRKQGDFTADRSRSVSYTTDVDCGVKPMSVFATDSIGYGLAQWTFHTRKRALLEYARKCEKSVGDLQLQLDFLAMEMESDYKAVSEKLKHSGDLQATSNAVLFYYENPADKSTAVQTNRANYGRTFYNAFKDSTPEENEKPTEDEIRKVFKWMMEELKIEL